MSGHGREFHRRGDRLLVVRRAERRILPVEERAVRHADEELRGSAVRRGRACHGYNAGNVLYAVRIAVFAELSHDRARCGLFVQRFAVARHAAALDHEPGYDAVHAQPFIEPALRKLDEISHRLRRLVGAQRKAYLLAAREFDLCSYFRHCKPPCRMIRLYHAGTRSVNLFTDEENVVP